MPLELIGRKAKLQFVISPPVDDPDFAADYALALERLKAIQEDVAGSPKRREHFIEGESMKLNFNLFTKKVRRSLCWGLGTYVDRIFMFIPTGTC